MLRDLIQLMMRTMPLHGRRYVPERGAVHDWRKERHKYDGAALRRIRAEKGVGRPPKKVEA